MSAQRRVARRLLPFLLLIVALVLLVDWAGTRKATTYGPTLIAEATDGRIWLVIDEDVFIAGADGAVAGRVDADRTRIARPITALGPLPDGGMLVGSRTHPRWYEVDAQGVIGSTVDLGALGGNAPFDSFKLAYSAARDLVVLADTSNHRLLALRRDGSLVLPDETARLAARGLFRFPNGVLFSRDGEIVVVNTNRHGLLKLGPALELKATFATADRTRSVNRWPAMAAEAPDGGYYVTVLGNDMTTGALVRLGRDGAPLAAPAFPAEAEPTAVVARRDDVLVSDQGRYRILRFDHDGRALADFGDAQIAGALAAAKTARSTYAVLTVVAQGALILVLPVLLWAYRREQNRAESAVLADGTLELPPAPRFGLRLTFATLSAFSLTFFVGGQLVLLGWIVQVASQGIRGMRGGIAVSLIELAAFLAISLSAAAGFGYLARKGTFAPMWAWVGTRLWNRHAPALRRYLDAGEAIMWRGLAVRRRRLCLVALTASRVYLVALAGAHIRRVERGERSDISGVTRDVVSPRWWRRLLGAVPLFAVRFVIGRDDCELRFFDEEAAAALALALEETAASARRDADGLTVARPADGGADPVAQSTPAWRQLVLAAMLPGLGQLSQGRLWAGILFLTALGVNVIAWLRPVVAHARRTMDVSPRILVAAGVSIGLVWVVAWLDAYVQTRLDRRD